ncbi:MAG TPA: PP2C family protein-serine/threonine phosphatase, partial [Melioribacteraceae bacterium]|nr:PP2C family protein-serine/threonine phosphatase [Melioribacteraceae bacterium]
NKISGNATISVTISSKGIDNNIITNIDKTRRGNYTFEAKSYNKTIDDSVKLKINIAGKYITNFSLQSEKIDKTELGEYEFVFEILSVVVYFIILIAMIIAAFKRYRAYEIGFKTAIIVATIGGLAVIINFAYVKIAGGWEFLLPLFFGFLFSFGGYLIIMAVSESITREIWSEKLISLDLIINGYFLHNKVGKAILRGISFGMLLTALYLFILFVINSFTNFSVSVFKDEVIIFDNILSPVFPFVKSLNNILFPLIVIFLYIGTFIRSRTKNRAVFIIITSIIWSVVARDNTSPIYLGFIIQFLIGIVISWIIWKYDFLTILFALITAYSFLLISWFALLPEAGFIVQVIIFVIFLIFGIFALFSKYRLDDLNKITPKFQKHISERQRLQGELAVAREVQMSFLPQKSPLFNGLDIAAKCLPAYEVGGDYYDFIKFSDNHFGIAIGDVSGKGTKAAFYMTLTKGFLKATSRFSTYPAFLLTDMNAMFYENVERGNFISMIFAMINMEKKVLSFSRAGHNPLLYKKFGQNLEVLKPSGIALGLEKGEVFAKTITEQNINISSGDYVIMFTDGITEAENSKSEEYGLDRLIELINNSNFNDANELLNLVYNDVHKFTGKTTQHDDMTMIVIRVL